MRPSPSAVLVLALSTACVAVDPAPPRDRPLVVQVARPVRAWNVVDGAEIVGRVVRFENPFPPEQPWFSVRNPWHQEVGMVDTLGRAWRAVPHQDGADWIGSGTVLDGARDILRAGASARMVEIRVEELRSAEATS